MCEPLDAEDTWSARHYYSSYIDDSYYDYSICGYAGTFHGYCSERMYHRASLLNRGFQPTNEEDERENM